MPENIPSEKILFVDDEPNVLIRALRKRKNRKRSLSYGVDSDSDDSFQRGSSHDSDDYQFSDEDDLSDIYVDKADTGSGMRYLLICLLIYGSLLGYLAVVNPEVFSQGFDKI